MTITLSTSTLIGIIAFIISSTLWIAATRRHTIIGFTSKTTTEREIAKVAKLGGFASATLAVSIFCTIYTFMPLYEVFVLGVLITVGAFTLGHLTSKTIAEDTKEDALIALIVWPDAVPA